MRVVGDEALEEEGKGVLLAWHGRIEVAGCLRGGNLLVVIGRVSGEGGFIALLLVVQATGSGGQG